MRLALLILVLFALGCGSRGDGEGKNIEGDQLEINNSASSNPAIEEGIAVDLESETSDVIGKRNDRASEVTKNKKQPEGDWTDVSILIPEAKLDIRYATENNFVKKQLYKCPTCWLRPDAAIALQKVQLELKTKGYGLVLFDCYRPRPVQQALWDIMPNAAYVTPPSKGSMHNRGKAVDLSLTDLEGNQLDMGTTFDFFGRAAHSDNRDHPADILERRDLLTGTMEKFGFQGIRTEWWHFSFGGKPAELSDELWKCD